MNRCSVTHVGNAAVWGAVLAVFLCLAGAAAAEDAQERVGKDPQASFDASLAERLVDVRPTQPAQPWLLVDAPFGPFTLFPTVVVWPWWQPLGHEVVPLGPNGYVYRPIYPLAAEDLGPPPAPDAEASHGDAAAIMERAVAAARAGDYQAALASLDLLLARDPADGYAHLLRAFVLLMLREYPAASDALHRALWTLPREEWGAVAANWQDYVPEPAAFDRALHSLEWFVRQHPFRPEGHFLLGYHYGYLGRHREAVDELSEALELYQIDGVAPELLEFFRSVPPAESPPRDF